MVVSALAKVRADQKKFGLEADWGSILGEDDPPARGPTGNESASYKAAFGPALGTQPPPPEWSAAARWNAPAQPLQYGRAAVAQPAVGRKFRSAE